MTRMRPVIIATIAALFVGALGGGGAVIFRLLASQRATLQDLDTARTTLADVQQTRDLLEREHRQLVEDYDLIKRRWTEADQRRQQLEGEAARLQNELSSDSSERDRLSNELDAIQQVLQTTQQQMKQLEQREVSLKQTHQAEMADLEAKALLHDAALKAQVTALAQHPTLSLSEAESFAATWAANQAEQQRLREHLAALTQTLESRKPEPPPPALSTSEVQRESQDAQPTRLSQADPTRVADVVPKTDVGDAEPTSSAHRLPRSGWRMIWRWLMQ